jgi:hypothetical protein
MVAQATLPYPDPDADPDADPDPDPAKESRPFLQYS